MKTQQSLWNRNSLCFLLFLLFPLTLSWVYGQKKGDIKFYNLEKEYAKTLTYVYPVQRAEALELKQIVDGMLSIYGTLYVNEKNNSIYITDVSDKLKDLRKILPSLDTKGLKAGNNLVTKVEYLKHENAEEVGDLLKHKLSQEGRVYEVAHLNALVITDVASKIDEVIQTLRLIDVPSKHLAIEVSVVEFNNETFSKVGINVFSWLQGLSVRAYGGNGARQVRVESNVPLDPRLSEFPARNVGDNLEVGAAFEVGDLVSFLSEYGDGSVLASTRLVTRNNKQVMFQAQEVIPERKEFRSSLASANSGGSLTAVSGFSVALKPTLQQDSLIHLKVTPSIATLTGWSPSGAPIVFTRELNTEVKVKDNEIFALGGLKKKEVVEKRIGVPLLKEIPIIKYLFSVKQKSTLEREIMMFIRPSTQASTTVSKEAYESMKEKFEKAVK